MHEKRKNIAFTLLVALYFLTSQATVIVLVVQWYSTAAHQSVQMRADNARETGELLTDDFAPVNLYDTIGERRRKK